MRRLALMALFAAGACKPPQMTVDPSLAARSDLHPIARASAVQSADATIGPWRTHVVTMATSRERGSISFSTRRVDVRITFGRAGFWVLQFELTDGAATWATQCENANDLQMTCRTASGEASWELRAEKTPRPNVSPVVEATLTGPSGTWRLAQERATAAPPHLFVRGYVALRGSEAVGAVEVLNDGRIWIDRALDPADRGAIVSVLYALWLLKTWLDESNPSWRTVQ